MEKRKFRLSDYIPRHDIIDCECTALTNQLFHYTVQTQTIAAYFRPDVVQIVGTYRQYVRADSHNVSLTTIPLVGKQMKIRPNLADHTRMNHLIKHTTGLARNTRSSKLYFY